MPKLPIAVVPRQHSYSWESGYPLWRGVQGELVQAPVARALGIITSRLVVVHGRVALSVLAGMAPTRWYATCRWPTSGSQMAHQCLTSLA